MFEISIFEFAHRIRLTVSTGLFGQQRIFRAESPLGQRILGALESLSPVTYPRGTKFRPGLAQPDIKCLAAFLARPHFELYFGTVTQVLEINLG